MEDLEAKQERIKELEAENAYLRQEIRGLRKELKKIAPLFTLSFAPSGYSCGVDVRTDDGRYWTLLEMSIKDECAPNEVFEVYGEIVDVFRQRGYE